MILILTCAYFSRWVGSIADYCMYLSYKKNVGSKIHPGRWTWFTWECTNQIINSLNFEFSMSGPRLPSPPPVPPVVPAAPASPSTESTKSSEKQCEVQISQRSLPVWGGHQTMQIYGIFGGISRFILFLHEVWVGNIKDYLFHEFLNTFQDATVIDFLSLKKTRSVEYILVFISSWELCFLSFLPIDAEEIDDCLEFRVWNLVHETQFLKVQQTKIWKFNTNQIWKCN